MNEIGTHVNQVYSTHFYKSEIEHVNMPCLGNNSKLMGYIFTTLSKAFTGFSFVKTIGEGFRFVCTPEPKIKHTGQVQPRNTELQILKRHQNGAIGRREERRDGH